MSERIASVDLRLLEVRDQKHRLETDVTDLAESILSAGQINPITVKKVGDKYRIISGRRRFSALKYIQEKLQPSKKIQALVYIKDVDALREELINIDENIMRENLSDAEFDEAIFRRKQIYEELHPDTKHHVSGGVAKSGKAKAPVAFTKDAAKKLRVSRKSIERAISRASRASDEVKKARKEGMIQSKVDALVALDPKDQDILLPIIKKQDLSETKTLIEQAKKVGAKAAVLYFADQAKSDPALKPLLRDAERFGDTLAEAIRDDLELCGPDRHEDFKMLEEIQKRLEKFLQSQRSKLGYIQAIRRRDGDRKAIRA